QQQHWFGYNHRHVGILEYSWRYDRQHQHGFGRELGCSNGFDAAALHPSPRDVTECGLRAGLAEIRRGLEGPDIALALAW
ncbi:hypothetical protein, partial [Mesorhizobium sp. L103C105A0]|uniref:hypothetical protein n=1 Tax=Mesorhizobium sp. L103C105A0 TaxID=1287074 RepID=UPI001AEBBCA9